MCCAYMIGRGKKKNGDYSLLCGKSPMKKQHGAYPRGVIHQKVELIPVGLYSEMRKPSFVEGFLHISKEIEKYEKMVSVTKKRSS